MTAASSRPFRLLAVTTSVMVYLLIVVGGIVRITGSGLGCPDWPLCHGQVVPPADMAAIIEYTHRVVAALGGVLMVATLVLAWRDHRAQRWITVPITASIALLVVQVPLGGLIVVTELEPLAVAFHLGMAMLIFAGVLLTTVAAHAPAPGAAPAHSGPRRPGYLWLLGVTLVAVFLLLLTGAFVVGTDSQLACPDWPLCHGGLLPPPNSSPQVGIHLLHRYTVAANSILLALVVIATLRLAGQQRALTRWAAVLGALFAVQVVIGGVQVLLVIPTLWRIVHLAAASAVWGSLVVLAGLTLVGRAEPAARRSSTPSEEMMATPTSK